MKRHLLSLIGLVALASSTSCGTFTNVPAQIRIADTVPGTVTYEKPDTDAWRNIKVETPSLKLMAEPGSVGATFELLKVDYLQINGTRVPSTEIPPMDLRMSVRVESSNYPTNPLAGPLTQEQIGKTVYVGQATVALPIVTRHVTTYGGKQDVNAAALTAQLQLIGTDDAGFPIQLNTYVPIVFLGPPR